MKPPPLRHRPVPAILWRLGLNDEDPRCPLDGWAILVEADRWCGMSLRCARDGCRIGAWDWPENLLEDLGDVIRRPERDKDEAPKVRAEEIWQQAVS